MGIIALLSIAAALLAIIGTAAITYTLYHPQRRTMGYALATGLPTDPSEIGFSFIERRFRFTDGSSTLGWIIEGSNPTGPTVIMTHGWSSSRYASLARVPVFARFASRVVVYDMRGHGDSTATICRLATTETDDLHELIDQIDQADTPDTPVVLFGSSMGAGISIVAAANCSGQPIAGVITEGIYRYALEPIIGQMRQHKYPVYPIVWFVGLLLSIHLGWLGRFDRARHASQIHVPILVMHGTADPISRLESSRQIAQAAQAGKLVEFQGYGHTNLAAADEPKYLQALEEFFCAIGADSALSNPASGNMHAPALQKQAVACNQDMAAS